MTNYLEITAHQDEIDFLITKYTSNGLHLVDERKQSDGLITLVFEGNRDAIAEHYTSGDKAFLEFEDGTVSPLYIKRERNFWDDD